MRRKTPLETQTLCGRCGKVANPDDGWEYGWPLHGTIDIGFPSQIFARLAGATTCADEEHFEAWQIGHPACTRNDAQRVTFSWRHDTEWRLCYGCQGELLQTIGRFFGYGKNSEILAEKRMAHLRAQARLLEDEARRLEDEARRLEDAK